jgi:hypothetical protein
MQPGFRNYRAKVQQRMPRILDCGKTNKYIYSRQPAVEYCLTIFKMKGKYPSVLLAILMNITI